MVTEGAVCGSSLGRRACVPKGAAKKLPPCTGEIPGDPATYRGVALAALPTRLLASVLTAYGWTVRPGAPELRP
jgi:hypothetical protein